MTIKNEVYSDHLMLNIDHSMLLVDDQMTQYILVIKSLNAQQELCILEVYMSSPQ